MGEIAEMMLDGTLCEGCGRRMGDAVGFPSLCAPCAKERRAAGMIKPDEHIHVHTTPPRNEMTTEIQESSATALTVTERAAAALGGTENEKVLLALAIASVNIVAITNGDGYKECHSARMALKTARVNLVRNAKIARDVAHTFGKSVIAEEARRIAIIEPEELRLKGLQKLWDDAREAERMAALREEAARVDGIHAYINNIRLTVTKATGEPSAWISGILDRVREIELTPEKFAEFLDTAKAAKADTIETLQCMLSAAEAQEAAAQRIKEERAELVRLRAADAAARKAADELAAAASAAVDRHRAAQESAARAERAEVERLAAIERAAEDRRIDIERAKLRAEQDDAREKLRAEIADVERRERAILETEQRARDAEAARVNAEQERALKEQLDALAAEAEERAKATAAIVAAKPRTRVPSDLEIVNAVAYYFGESFGTAATWVLNIDRAAVERLMAVSDEQFEEAQ